MSVRPMRAVSATIAAASVLAAAWLGSTLVRPTAAQRRAVPIPAFDELRQGDLIFRSGVSPDSAMVRFVDPDSAYSHVGLIDIADGNPFVVHSEAGPTTGGSDIRREPLAMFLAADRANGFAVFHLAAADRERGRAAVDAALRYRAAGVTFDQRADLATEHEQYCAELVWRVYRMAGLDLLDGDLGPTPAILGRPAVRLTALQHSRHLDAGVAR